MRDLSDELDDLSDLDELRNRARALKNEGMAALRKVHNNRLASWNGRGKIQLADPGDDKARAGEDDKVDAPRTFPEWQGSGGKIEAAMLVRVHCKLRSSPAHENNEKTGPDSKLVAQLTSISLLQDLLQIVPQRDSGRGKKDLRSDAEEPPSDVDEVPVLLAARAMQALVPSPEHTFSRATMLCYYRILREICVADSPDWNAGGARAGTGGEVTAYVTAECIRAVLMMERSIRETAAFFRETDRFHRYARYLEKVKGAPETWRVIEAERATLEWYTTMARRQQYLALDIPLFDPDQRFGGGTDAEEKVAGSRNPGDGKEATDPNRFTLAALMDYFQVLGERIHAGLQASVIAFNQAASAIKQARVQEETIALELARERAAANAAARAALYGPEFAHAAAADADEYEDPDRFVRRDSRFVRSMSAHEIAAGVIEKAVEDARIMVAHCKDKDGPLHNLLPLATIFDKIAREVRVLLDPAERYIASVLDHELTAASQQKPVWDARELAFAAGAYGALTEWSRDERLDRAAQLLSNDISEDGLFRLGRPLHSVPSGLRWQPLHFEVCRAFSELLANVDMPVTPKLIGQMLFPFKQMSMELKEDGGQEPYLLLASRTGKPPKLRGWHMEDPPIPARPTLWVSGHAVLALDKLVRMLDQKINKIILKYFTFKEPDKIGQGLDDLFYPDYGRTLFYKTDAAHPTSDDAPEESVGITLQRMRAHIVGVQLPRAYSKAVYSMVLHGPPGTGKTTLLEALAHSSGVPLIEMSPSDIAVKGEQAIEARARATFQALSMLTRVVIIFDEFESVLQRREIKEDTPESRSMYTFLTPGMLPKLTRLYNEARTKHTAYALVTNLLQKLDDAAIRPGRFDRHLGIYMPDPVSRAGWFTKILSREIERKAHEAAGKAREKNGSEESAGQAEDAAGAAAVPGSTGRRTAVNVKFELTPGQKATFDDMIRKTSGVPPSRLTPRWLNVLNGKDFANGGGDHVLYGKEWTSLDEAALPHPVVSEKQYRMLYLAEEHRLNAWEWAVREGAGDLDSLLVEPETEITRRDEQFRLAYEAIQTSREEEAKQRENARR